MKRPLRDIGLSVKRLQMRHHRAINAALARLGISLVQSLSESQLATFDKLLSQVLAWPKGDALR